jgi:hypothetical protein
LLAHCVQNRKRKVQAKQRKISTKLFLASLVWNRATKEEHELVAMSSRAICQEIPVPTKIINQQNLADR